jgi:hypothetical protein
MAVMIPNRRNGESPCILNCVQMPRVVAAGVLKTRCAGRLQLVPIIAIAATLIAPASCVLSQSESLLQQLAKIAQSVFLDPAPVLLFSCACVKMRKLPVAALLLVQCAQALRMASISSAKVAKDLLPSGSRRTSSTAASFSLSEGDEFVQGVAEAADAILHRLSQQRAERMWRLEATYPSPRQPEPEQRLSVREAPSAPCSRALSEVLDIVPGGRHDNDFADFRSVNNVPTIGELASDKFPFLPKPEDDWPVLDRQYRLLRHDLVTSIREKLRESTAAGTAGAQRGGRQPPVRLVNAARTHVCAATDKDSLCSIWFNFDLPKEHYAARLNRAARKEWWESGGGKTLLKFESLVALVPRSSTNSSSSSSAEQAQPLLLGEVQWRDAAELAGSTYYEQQWQPLNPHQHRLQQQLERKQQRQQQQQQRGKGSQRGRGRAGNGTDDQSDGRDALQHTAPKQIRPRVGIRFFTEQDTATALSWAHGAAVADIVPVPVSLCSYLPVLQRLQTMRSAPLAKEIVHWAAPSSTDTGISSTTYSSSSSGSTDSSSISSSSDSTDSSSSSTTDSGAIVAVAASAAVAVAVAAATPLPRPAYDAQSDCDAVKALADAFTPTAAEALERAPLTVTHLNGLKLTPQLDYSQRAAVASALSQELAIVQGPPGTGKTFIGCTLAKVSIVTITIYAV